MYYRIKMSLAIPLALFTLLSVVSNTSYSATQVSQAGITWTFDKDYTVGQFVNGDYWVIDPGAGVNVISVTPGRTGSGVDFRHGSVINPMGTTQQGYDGRVDSYTSSLSVVFPIIIKGGNSLVSSKSITTETPDCSKGFLDVYGYCVYYNTSGMFHSYLYSAAVLTVVSATPPANSFRPPYVGKEKPFFSSNNLNKEALPRLSLTSKPTVSYLNYVANEFKNVWLDHRIGNSTRMMHPVKNMPNYGRDLGTAVSEASCLLMLDYTDQELDPLLINFVQTGIDLYYMAKNGTYWTGEGGHDNGRKWPMIFAGIMLNNDAMMNIAQTGIKLGCEDEQTYQGVSEALWGRNCTSAYTATCSGSGAKDCRDPDGLKDGCTSYRVCCTSMTWVGESLAIRLMGAETLWDHDPFFNYVDRWMSGSVSDGGTVSGGAFVKAMWNTYRPQLGTIGKDSPVFDPIGNKTVAENTTLTFSVRATSSSGAVITYLAQNLPSGATFTGSTFSWKPATSQVGSYNVAFVASDGTSQTTQTITITVTNTNQAPVFTPIGNKTVHAQSQLAFTLAATDPDGDLITYSAANMPAGATLTGNTFSWTPTTAQIGTYTVTFTASDGKLSASQQVTITVTGTNNPPVIGAVSSQSVEAGKLLSFAVPMSDPDGDSLLCAAMNLPSGATFQNDTFQWTPASSQAGSYTVTFYANDSQLTTTKDIAIAVTAAPATPAITVIIDNATANTASSGNWKTSDAPNPYGGRSVWGYNGATYTWVFKPTVTGTYRVSMWWTSLSTRSSSVPVKIPYSSGTATVNVNQQLNGGKWNTLGQYTFNAGTTYRVVMTAPNGSPPSTCADAVKFEKL